MKKLAFAAAAVALTPEAATRHWGVLALTGRSPFFYLGGLRLWGYDFANKKVLDVGAGWSRFSQLVNLVYQSTGTVAVPLDLQLRPRGPNGTKASATRLPFSDATFDLVTNNMSFVHFDGTEDGYFMLDEMIRVTRPGGQISLGMSLFGTSLESLEYLRNHPAVEKVKRHWIPFLSLQSNVKIVTRPYPVSDQSIVDYNRTRESKGEFAPWRLSLIPRPTTPAEKIEFLRRKATLGIGATDAENTEISRMIPERSLDPAIRSQAVAYLDRALVFDPTLLLRAWSALDQSSKNQILTELIPRMSAAHPFLANREFSRLPGNYSAEVQSLFASTESRVRIQEIADRHFGSSTPRPM